MIYGIVMKLIPPNDPRVLSQTVPFVDSNSKELRR